MCIVLVKSPLLASTARKSMKVKFSPSKCYNKISQICEIPNHNIYRHVNINIPFLFQIFIFLPDQNIGITIESPVNRNPF